MRSSGATTGSLTPDGHCSRQTKNFAFANFVGLSSRWGETSAARSGIDFSLCGTRQNHRLKSVPHQAMRFILISLLRFYKAVVSPWLPPSCRFVPTCSEYAREAIERYGAVRGTGMAIWRLLRCQPFCAGGYDPVK